MNLSTLLIRHNYNITIANLQVNGKAGSITITQTPSQSRTDVASVVVKLEGEKAHKQKINTMVQVEDLQNYLSEFYVNAEYVQSWSI